MVADAAVEPERRTLVLTAFPTEADAILARTTLDENPVVVEDGRRDIVKELRNGGEIWLDGELVQKDGAWQF